MSALDRRCEALLDQWPSNQTFTAAEALEHAPELQGDVRVYAQLIAEEFLRRRQHGETISPSQLLKAYPDAPASLEHDLQELAELDEATGSFATDSHDDEVFPSAGESLLGYVLLEEIGRGAYSRVFLAADENAGHRRVVVKITRSGRKEAELLGPLRHPNLPTVLSCRTDSSRQLTVLCMEFIGARTLRDEVCERHPCSETVHQNWSPQRVVDVLRQVASGLAHAHEQGVLHLDIKPGNVLLGDNDRAVLIDFNLGIQTARSHTAAFRGTLPYAAPEVLESAARGDLGPTPMGPACDIYSLGVVLFEMLTGELPWPAPDAGTVTEAARQGLASRRSACLRPSASNPTISRGLDEIVAKALAYSPANRFQTAREFATALSACHSTTFNDRSLLARSIPLVTVAVVMLGVLFGTLPATHTGTRDQQATSETTAPGNLSHVAGAQQHVVHFRAPEVVPPSTLDELTNCSEPELRQRLHTLQSHSSETDPATHLASIGFIQLLLEDYRGAAASLRQVVRLQPECDISVWCNLGYCYVQLNQHAAAIKTLETALEVAPENETALFLRSVVDVERSRRQELPATSTTFERLATMTTDLSDRLEQALRELQDDVRSDRLRRPPEQRYRDRQTTETVGDTLSAPLPHPQEPGARELGLPVDMSLPLAHLSSLSRSTGGDR